MWVVSGFRYNNIEIEKSNNSREVGYYRQTGKMTLE